MSALPVLCFPPAGCSASFFGPWRRRSGRLRVVPVELPGRERRFAEPAHVELASLVRALVPELLAEIGDARRVAVFGHSFGAVLGFEVVRAMTRLAGGPGLELVVSGSAAPGVPRGVPVAGLPDDELLAGVRRMTGWHDPVLDEPEMRELLLPALRADVMMHEAYDPGPLEPLPVPVTALRGQDDPLVSAAGAARWAAVTDGGFRLAELPGGHMYLTEAWSAVLELLERVLAGERVGR